MKVKIIDPNGVVYAGRIVPKGEVIEIQKGPHTDAWLRFEQCEVIKSKDGASAEESKPEETEDPEKKKK